MSQQLSVLKAKLDNDVVKQEFKKVLGNNSSAFIASIFSEAKNNAMIAQCTPNSIINACMIAATLNLPVDKNLGLAYIVPYNSQQGKQAQFQIGYRGFIQLALRSGEFHTLNVTDIREGEIKSVDRLTGKYTFNWIQDDLQRENTPIIGYASFFELKNGFEKTLYSSIAKIQAHGKKYSKNYNHARSLWKTDFDAMARKTVLKSILKFAPMSVEFTGINTALKTDQAVVNDLHGQQVEYPDNPETVDVSHEEVAIVLSDTDVKKLILSKAYLSLDIDERRAVKLEDLQAIDAHKLSDENKQLLEKTIKEYEDAK